MDWSNMWNPDLYVNNTGQSSEVSIRHSMNYDASGRASVFEKQHIVGWFDIDVSLANFPFDTQVRTVIPRASTLCCVIMQQIDTFSPNPGVTKLTRHSRHVEWIYGIGVSLEIHISYF